MTEPQIKTVLGNISPEELGVVLPHEHICCYFEYFYTMLGNDYLDKTVLCEQAVKHLTEAKQKFGLSTVVDCTPVNIGRDLELLRKVSRASGIHIVSASGFYYTEEAVLADLPEEQIAARITEDIHRNGIGVLKFAVETPEMSKLLKKLLSALCTVQMQTNLPFIIHTNAKNENGREILSFVLERGVSPSAVTLGHLSGTEDMDYVTELLSSGIYIGFDRICKSSRPEYYAQKARDLYILCERGFSNRILLSHDGLVYNGFRADAHIREDNPYTPIFERLLPAMREIGFTQANLNRLIVENPKHMLLCY